MGLVPVRFFVTLFALAVLWSAVGLSWLVVRTLLIALVTLFGWLAFRAAALKKGWMFERGVTRA